LSDDFIVTNIRHKEILNMITDNERFKNPSTAREYIKSLAICFEDPYDLSEFLGMCDIVQAVFVNLIIEEIGYERIHPPDCLILDDYEYERQSKIMNALNNCKHAEEEIEHVKQMLKLIISKLIIATS